jgi:hypothetical protein
MSEDRWLPALTGKQHLAITIGGNTTARCGSKAALYEDEPTKGRCVRCESIASAEVNGLGKVDVWPMRFGGYGDSRR